MKETITCKVCGSEIKVETSVTEYCDESKIIIQINCDCGWNAHAFVGLNDLVNNNSKRKK